VKKPAFDSFFQIETVSSSVHHFIGRFLWVCGTCVSNRSFLTPFDLRGGTVPKGVHFEVFFLEGKNTVFKGAHFGRFYRGYGVGCA
jgi:hypothetical protein